MKEKCKTNDEKTQENLTMWSAPFQNQWSNPDKLNKRCSMGWEVYRLPQSILSGQFSVSSSKGWGSSSSVTSGRYLSLASGFSGASGRFQGCPLQIWPVENEAYGKQPDPIHKLGLVLTRTGSGEDTWMTCYLRNARSFPYRNRL